MSMITSNRLDISSDMKSQAKLSWRELEGLLCGAVIDIDFHCGAVTDVFRVSTEENK